MHHYEFLIILSIRTMKHSIPKILSVNCVNKQIIHAVPVIPAGLESQSIGTKSWVHSPNMTFIPDHVCIFWGGLLLLDDYIACYSGASLKMQLLWALVAGSRARYWKTCSRDRCNDDNTYLP
jgi:hypothetical protein